MDKSQKQLIDTYYRKRGIAVGMGNGRYGYKPYEYSNYALQSGIMSFDKLSIGDKYNIYRTHTDQRVKDAVLPLIEAYNKSAQGMMRIILDYNRTSDPEPLHAFIVGSQFIKGNQAENDVDIRGDMVYLGVSEKDLTNVLDLNDDFSYLSATASGQYGNGYTDSSEADYMWHNIGGENQSKVMEIAGKLGVRKKTKDEFSEEGKLSEFFEDYDMTDVTDEYLLEYGNAKDEAEEEEARKQIKSIPIDIDNQKFDLDDVLEFLYRHDLKEVNTFDDFLIAVGDHNDIYIDALYEAGYNQMDFTELQRGVRDELDKISDDLEDPSNERYHQVEAVADLQNAMKRYGFTVSSKPDVIGVRKQKDKIIEILGYEFDPEGYKDEKLVKIEVLLTYPTGKKRQGWIWLGNLKNYIDQPELPHMREWDVFKIPIIE